MGILGIENILKATGGRLICKGRQDFAGLSIDSRTIKEGELFVALEGDNFDGHNFLASALEKGAGAIVSRMPEGHPAGTLVLVDDTLKALQDLGHFLRMKRTVPVVGVTGTNGKTTTKELIASVLSQKNKALKTTGNLNNHIGVPLCLARMEGDETAMVIEMGSNVPGDIKLLCDIARPDIAAVTNVGPAHLEGFGSLEMVRQTDLEILEYVNTVAVNADDAFLMQGMPMKGYKGRIITYGIKDGADVSAKDITLLEKGSCFRLCLPGERETDITLNIAGGFNISNALAAAAVADIMGISPDDIKKGLESFDGVPMRLSIQDYHGVTVISDVYNANPASMDAALNELVRLKQKRAIAVLGDMLELGAYAEDAHKNLVRKMNELHIDILIAVGSEMNRASSLFEGACHTAGDSVAAGNILIELCREGDTILAKGSRGMRMEKTVDALRQKEGVNVV